jgi:hypothetical protein
MPDAPSVDSPAPDDDATVKPTEPPKTPVLVPVVPGIPQPRPTAPVADEAANAPALAGAAVGLDGPSGLAAIAHSGPDRHATGQSRGTAAFSAMPGGAGPPLGAGTHLVLGAVGLGGGAGGGGSGSSSAGNSCGGSSLKAVAVTFDALQLVLGREQIDTFLASPSPIYQSIPVPPA